MHGVEEKKAIWQALGAIGMYRVPLQQMGYSLEKGFIFIFEDDHVVMQVQERLINLWHACKVDNKTELKEICNFEIGVHRYRKYDSIKDIENFLEEKTFFPLLLVAGILPQELVGAGYAFFLADDVDCVQVMSEEYREMSELVHQIEVLLYTIKNAEKSTLMHRYHRNDQYDDCMRVFIATAEIWGIVYKEEFAEVETANWKEDYCEALMCRLNQMEDVYDLADVEEVVKMCVLSYLTRRKNIKFKDLQKPVSDVNHSILYDEESYYFAEAMLKEACAPITETVSFIQVKKEMELSGMLACNDTAKKNYTVKKACYNQEQEKVARPRFIKISREKMHLSDGIEMMDIVEMERNHGSRTI